MNNFEVAQIILGAIKHKLSVWFPGGPEHITPTQLLIPSAEYHADKSRWDQVLAAYDSATYLIADTTVFSMIGATGSDITYFSPTILPYINTTQ